MAHGGTRAQLTFGQKLALADQHHIGSTHWVTTPDTPSSNLVWDVI